MILRKEFSFEASHILPRHPGKCSRLHGHSWRLYVFVEGKINPETGFVKDYADISKAVNPLVESLDHKHLGQWNLGKAEGQEWASYLLFNPAWQVSWLPVDFYPSSENLLWAIGKELCEQDFRWSKIALEETCTSYAELTREEFESGQA